MGATSFAFVGVPRQSLFGAKWSLCSHRVSEQVFFWLPWDFCPLNADETVESPQHSLAFFSLWDCTGGKRAESGGKQAGDWKRVRQKSQNGVFFNRNGAFAGTGSQGNTHFCTEWDFCEVDPVFRTQGTQAPVYGNCTKQLPS